MYYQRDVSKFRRFPSVNSFTISTENLQNLHHSDPCPCQKPIAFSKHAKLRRKSMPQTSKFDPLKQTQPKGIILIWPQKQNNLYEREYAIFIRVLALTLYWANEIGLYPSGNAVPVKRPPWFIRPPLPEPENRDYIIEPDWNSA